MNQYRINCVKCKYYYVTWEAKHPKGCRYYGFKSSKVPSVVVFESSGTKCIGFELKNK